MSFLRRALRIAAGLAAVTGIMTFHYSEPMRQLRSLPSQMYVAGDGARLLPIALEKPFEVDVQGGEMQVISGMDETLSSVTQIRPEGDVATVHVRLFGVLPIKDVTISQRNEQKIIPGGTSIGVTLYTKGALVVGTADIVTSTGEVRNPAAEAGLLAGDIIERVNGVDIVDAAHLSSIINEQQGRGISMDISRKSKRETLHVQPVKDAQDNNYRLGIWVRDSTAGVGTLSFYDPQRKWYGALGHAIVDIDTKANLSVRKGEIIEAQIIDIKQGSRGEPGELKGTFDMRHKALGDIRKNTDYGIYGQMYEAFANPLYPEGLPIAHREDVVEGPCELLATIDDTGIQSFSCEVIRVHQQTAPAPKGIIIRVTDPRLLRTTGGIVQGMSGSPLIQNGHIIGAVTHVFVNDPTRGYGIFIDWMLEQTNGG